MSIWSPKRLGLYVVVLLNLALFAFAADKDAKAPRAFTGQVKPLSEVLEKQGAKLDPDAAPYWLALIGADGMIYPLIKDDGARMFFKDRRLLNRPMQLTGRLLPNSGLLQVVEVHSLREGKLHEVYYWCEVCAIRRAEERICECCGGPMFLKEEPLKR